MSGLRRRVVSRAREKKARGKVAPNTDRSSHGLSAHEVDELRWREHARRFTPAQHPGQQAPRFVAVEDEDGTALGWLLASEAEAGILASPAHNVVAELDAHLLPAVFVECASGVGFATQLHGALEPLIAQHGFVDAREAEVPHGVAQAAVGHEMPVVAVEDQLI